MTPGAHIRLCVMESFIPGSGLSLLGLRFEATCPVIARCLPVMGMRGCDVLRICGCQARSSLECSRRIVCVVDSWVYKLRVSLTIRVAAQRSLSATPRATSRCLLPTINDPGIGGANSDLTQS